MSENIYRDAILIELGWKPDIADEYRLMNPDTMELLNVASEMLADLDMSRRQYISVLTEQVKDLRAALKARADQVCLCNTGFPVLYTCDDHLLLHRTKPGIDCTTCGGDRFMDDEMKDPCPKCNMTINLDSGV